MSCFCYLHIFPNDKIYVGTTQQKKVELRWKCDGSGYKIQPLIWRAIQKYGWENVKHKVIVCETPEEMWKMEKELIKKYDTTNLAKGYNISTGGEGGPVGCHRSEETKQKLSEINKGKHLSTEVKIKMSERRKGEGNPNYGKSLSEETKRRISESRKGKMMGENNPSKRLEVRRKISESKKGKPHPQPKYKWITPNGEIRIMDKANVTHYHKDWILIQNKE